MDADIKVSTMDTLALLECLRSHGITDEKIRSTTGIELSILDELDFKVPLNSLFKLWEMAAGVTRDPAIGIHLRSKYGNQYVHFVNYIGMNSKNVLESISHYRRYGALLSDAYEYDFKEEGDNFVFSFRILTQPYKNGWIPEYHLSLIVYLSSMLGLESVVFKEVRFQHACPTEVKIYEDFFKAPVFFEREENAVVASKELLELELPAPNPHLQAILKKRAEVALSKLSQTGSFSNRVENFVFKNLATGILDVEMTAKALNMHRTTLHRKLKENSTSFNHILTTIRQNLAKFYLNQGMNIDQVAFLLGYANRSSFQYAFKTWFDQTPGTFRQCSQ